MGTPEMNHYRVVVSSDAELQEVEAKLKAEIPGQYVVEKNENGQTVVVVNSEKALSEDLKIKTKESSNDRREEDNSITPSLPNLDGISFPNIFDIFSI
jgi:hypothetical protein